MTQRAIEDRVALLEEEFENFIVAQEVLAGSLSEQRSRITVLETVMRALIRIGAIEEAELRRAFDEAQDLSPPEQRENLDLAFRDLRLTLEAGREHRIAAERG